LIPSTAGRRGGREREKIELEERKESEMNER
jgi:hypothetical protein